MDVQPPVWIREEVTVLGRGGYGNPEFLSNCFGIKKLESVSFFKIHPILSVFLQVRADQGSPHSDMAELEAFFGQRQRPIPCYATV